MVARAAKRVPEADAKVGSAEETPAASTQLTPRSTDVSRPCSASSATTNRPQPDARLGPANAKSEDGSRLTTAHEARSTAAPYNLKWNSFPWSEGFDRMFRNEGITGSNPVSSTNRPGQGDFCSPSRLARFGIRSLALHRRPTTLRVRGTSFLRGAFSLHLTNAWSWCGVSQPSGWRYLNPSPERSLSTA